MSGFLFLQIYALLIPVVLYFRYYWVRHEDRKLANIPSPAYSELELAYLSGGAHHVVLVELCELVTGGFIEVDAAGTVRRGPELLDLESAPPLQARISKFIQARSQATFSELIDVTHEEVRQVEELLRDKGLLLKPGIISKTEYQSWYPVLALAAIGLLRVLYAKYRGFAVSGQIGMILVLLGLAYLLGVHSRLSPVAAKILRDERSRVREDQSNRFRKIILSGIPLNLPRDQHPFFAACLVWRINGQYTEGIGLKRSLIHNS